ncbi:MAG: hypothetical protein E7Z91_03510 [Cyanobacteria bacterium SIG30]|nr:hypothetical protein [Cyanobacteria bacterium SIG30]
MILEYKVDELSVHSAWLQTLYELVEELNCKCQTFFEEGYSSEHKRFSQTRTIKIRGEGTMLNWLKLRMERYSHFVNTLNARADAISSYLNEDDEL